MYIGLSRKQVDILEYIKKEIDTSGSSPSIRKICKEVGLSSTSSVHGHIVTLEKKGYIRKDPESPRSLSIVEKEVGNLSPFIDDVVNLPVIDEFTNLSDIFNSKNISQYIAMPKVMSWGEKDFIFKKSGDNMRNYGIFHKDYVIINPTAPIKNGALVLVSFLTDIVDIRKYCITKDGIVLKSINNLTVGDKSFKIIGVVTGNFKSIT
ncbi:MAG: transcriptional repressor LexA [Peptostreptococcaceae bacterium]